MNLDKSAIVTIISNHLKGISDDSEKAILEAWLMENSRNQDLFNELKDSAKLEDTLVQYNSFESNRAWKGFVSRLANVEKGNIRKISKFRIWYAACAVVLAGIFLYQYFQKPKEIQKIEILAEGKVLKDEQGEILPATTGAIIITSNGEQLSLDNSFKINDQGEILNEENNTVSNPTASNEINYYELIVPKAKIIHFTMFDGTKVWVNANSRLKIPTNTKDERRIVLVSGEAYFEVEKYLNNKFIVETTHGNVEVLGTKFNVNSLANTFKTTLVEGRVKLSNDFHETFLSPNYSAILSNNNFIVSKANLNAELSWKNNTFYFSNYTIQKIAEQIENWYGVQVKVGKDVAKSMSTYSGELRRDVPLTEVRKMLEFISGLDVTIEGEQLNINN